MNELALMGFTSTSSLVETGITAKFTNHVDKAEEQLKSETVGLVTLDKMKEVQKDIIAYVKLTKLFSSLRSI